MEAFEIVVTEDKNSAALRSPFFLVMGIILFALNVGILVKQFINGQFDRSFPGSWVYVGNLFLATAILIQYFQKKTKAKKVRYDGAKLTHNLGKAQEINSFYITDIQEVRHYATSTEVRLQNGESQLIPMGEMSYLQVQRVKALLTRDKNQEKEE